MVTPIYVDGRLYVPNGFGLTEAIDPKTGTHAVDAEAAHRRRRRAAVADDQQRRRVLGPRQRRAHPDGAPAAPVRAEPEDGGSRSRASATAARSISRRKSFATSGTACPSSPATSSCSARRCSSRTRPSTRTAPPGYVRAFDVRTGEAALDVEPRPARRRPCDRDVARRRVEVQRRRQRLVDVQRRRRARSRLRADVGRHERHVRRPSARQQPLRQLGRRAEREDRRARLALPDRASRSVRLRLAGRADLDRHHRRRPRRSKRWRKSRSTASCSCSIARRARPCGRSRSGPCRSRRCRARSRRRRSRIRPSRRRTSTKGSPRTTSSTSRRQLRAEALEIVKRYVIGPPFTPPSVIGDGERKLGTIQLAGASGGANWNGGAFDPETGMFYVGSRTRRVRRGPVRAGSRALGFALSRRHARDHERAARAAAHEAAVRPHHGVRSEPRRAGVDGAERRRAAESSGARRAESAAARRRDAVGRHRDEDAAVRDAKPTRARRARRRTSAARSSRRSTRRPARRSGRSISASARTARR